MMNSLNPGTDKNVSCHDTNVMEVNGLFFSDDNVGYLMRIFPLQLAGIAIIQSTFQFLLKPLGETPVVAQLLAGIIVGKLGNLQGSGFQKTMFPKGGFHLAETFGTFGCMLYLFLIGLKMDMRILKRSSRKEKVIGISTFCIPLILTMPVSFVLRSVFKEKVFVMPMSALLMSTSSQHVITSFLADLKILNTELGRIASAASRISGTCSWILIVILTAVQENEGTSFLQFCISALAQVIFIVVILRNIVVWMIKQTPKEEPVRDGYIFAIYTMIMGTGILGEYLGTHCTFGPMVLGLVIPQGPPIGSVLLDRLESFTCELLMPLYYCGVGSKMTWGKPCRETHQILAVFFTGFPTLLKFIATIIPCLIYRIPLQDASVLGLILSTTGTVDVMNLTNTYTNQHIPPEAFTLLMMTTLGVMAVISPVVHFLYDPSRKYIVYNKRTIQDLKVDSELRILVCIYEEENVPTIVKILEASNPTKQNPMNILLLHLLELAGRSTPLLISHKCQENLFGQATVSGHIINCFKIYEKQYNDAVVVQPFTALTRLLQAHQDICTMALDKKSSFLIIPFHKQWNIDGTTQMCKWANANKKVLKQAPCSVGILIDRSMLNGTRLSALSAWSTYSVGVIFLGDADDREAMCYAMRMAGHPKVYLTVHRFILESNNTDYDDEKILDNAVINEYRLDNKDNKRKIYKEEVISDVVGIIASIRSLENAYDLILVGRSHYSYSRCLSGVAEWNEHPELGLFGDIFASSDFRGNTSVLVIQQHCCMSTSAMRDPHEAQ